MFKSIFKIAHQSIVYIYGMVIAFIVVLNIFTSRNYYTITNGPPEFFNIITLLISIIFISLALLYRERIFTQIDKLPTLITCIGLLMFSAMLQLLIIKIFMVFPSWDFGVVINSTQTFLETGKLINYFITYTNNIFVVFLLALVGYIFSPSLIIFELFNVFMITISQYLIFNIGYKIGGKRTGFISLLISVLFFPYIFYAPIVYTDTLSLVFLLLPLSIIIDSKGKFSPNIIRITFASIILSFGMLLKGSLIVFIIALSIVILLFAQKYKKFLLFIPFISLFLIKTVFNFTVYELDILDQKQVEAFSFPATHWIMMGQNEESIGKWSQKDVQFTFDLFLSHSREEIMKIHLEETKNRLVEKGWRGNFSFTLEKISHTWTDGTYYSLNKLARNPFHPEHFQRLTDGLSGHLLHSFSRIQHLIMVFGLLFALRLKPKGEFLTFVMLSIIGFFLFFILWEARSRYLLSVTPLFILLSSYVYTTYQGQFFKRTLNLKK